MQFLSMTVAVLLIFVETGRTAEFFYTGKGIPYNWSNHQIADYVDKTFDDCKNICNNQKDCTTIFYCKDD